MVLAGGVQKCIGVELKVMGDDQLSCRYLEVSLTKNQLNLGKECFVNGTIKDVLNVLPKSVPIALVLTGKGILLKQIAGNFQELTPQQLFQQAFPALNEDEFYHQSLWQGNIAHLAISRKNWIDELLNRLFAAGAEVMKVSLGPHVATHVLQQLNVYDAVFSFDQHVFTLNEKKELLAYQFGTDNPISDAFKIASHPIAARSILAYAGAFQLLLYAKVLLVEATIEKVTSRFDHFLAKNMWKRNAIISLIVCFVLLLGSLITFESYNRENAVLVLQVGAKENTLTDAELLTANITKSELQLKQLQWNGGYSAADLINQAVKELPKQLTLKVIELKRNEELGTNEFKLNGTTKDLQAMNNWLFVLKQKPWAKAVDLLKYELPTDEESYEFTILITYE